MVELTTACRERVSLLFSHQSENAEAERLLSGECGENLPLYKGDYDRVRFAVLKLSNGNIELLRKQIELSKMDWRDTLVAAGFADDIHAHVRWMPGA